MKITGPKHLATVLGGDEKERAVRGLVAAVRGQFLNGLNVRFTQRWRRGEVSISRKLSHPFKGIEIEVWSLDSDRRPRKRTHEMVVRSANNVAEAESWSATVHWNYPADPLIFDAVDGNKEAMIKASIYFKLTR